MKSKKTGLFFLIIFFVQFASAQIEAPTLMQQLDAPDVGPKSPSAASFDTYGDYPINYSFGTLDISIPIFTAKSGNLSLPISISYYSGGIKVSNPGSWLGLGWVLNAGGVITRQMNGLPDEANDGFLSAPKEWYLDGIAEADYGILSDIGNTQYCDTKPDIFNYNFNGYFGKFMFNENGDVVMIPYKPLKIENESPRQGEHGLQIHQFTITTPEGIEYLFAKPEITEDFTSECMAFNSIPTYYSAWYLTKVTDLCSGDYISLTYSTINGPPQYYVPMVYTKTYPCHYISGYSPDNSWELDERTYSEDLSIKEQILESITFNTGKIVFSSDVRNYSGAKVYDNDNVKSTITFDLDPMDNGDNCEGSECSRMLLKSLIIDDKKWEFDYEDIQEPPLNTFGRDHWGYYNGKDDNDTPFPPVQIFGDIYGGNADRNTDPEMVKFGLLNKITYPTGGYTIFDFEANQYSIVDRISGTIRKYFEQSKSKTLTLDNGESSITKTYNWPGAYDWPCSGEPYWLPGLDISIEIGTVPNSSNTGPNQYSHPPFFNLEGRWDKFYKNYREGLAFYDQYTDMYIYRDAIHVDNTNLSSYSDNGIDDCTVTLCTSTSQGNYITYTIKRDGFCENTPATVEEANIYVGGTRIKQICNYDLAGKLASRKIYNYQDSNYPERSSGVLLSSTKEALITNQIYATNVYGSGNVCSATICNSTYNGHLIISDNPNSSMMLGGAHIAYKNVTETIVDKDGNTIGKTQYLYNSIRKNLCETCYPEKPVPNDNYKFGNLTEKKVYNNKSQLVQKIENSYHYIPCGTVEAISVAKNRHYNWSSYSCCCEQGYGQLPDMERYKYNIYNVRSYLNNKASEKRWDYTYERDVLKDSVLTETTYTYAGPYEDSNWKLLRKVSRLQSDGKTMNTEYKYYYELPTTEDIPRGYPGMLREQKKYYVTEEDEVTKHVVEAKSFDYEGNRLTRIYNWYKDEPDIEFEDVHVVNVDVIRDDNYEPEPYIKISYSSKKRPLQVIENEFTTSYLWAYKYSYPIAKIENSDYEIIESLVVDKLNDLGRLKDVDELNNLSDSELDDVCTYLRDNLTDAFVTSYTYDPFFGIISQTDPNGFTSHYLYDDLGRLDKIKDKHGNILKEYEYHYQGQNVGNFTGYYKITTEPGEKGTIVPEHAIAEGGENLVFTITPNEFYHVKDVKVNDASRGPLEELTLEDISCNTNVLVEFAYGPITVTKSGSGQITLVNEAEVELGSNFIYSITPSTGYYIKSVVVDEVSVTPRSTCTFENVTGAHTLNVDFSNMYKVVTNVIGDIGGSYSVFVMDGENTITPEYTEIEYGGDLRVSINSDEGYYIDKITNNETPVSGLTESTTVYNILLNDIQWHIPIEATFKIKTFDITTSIIGNGTILPNTTETVEYGENRSYVISPAANHHIKSVMVNGILQEIENNLTLNDIKEDKEILVEFEIDSYPITITKSGSGIISGLISVNHGNSATYNFSPSTGYYIKSVIADGVSVTPRSSYTFTNVTAPHTLHVEFSNVYLVHTTVVNNVGGSFTPTNPEVVYGDNVIVRISADEGYYIHKIIYEEVPLEGLRETITGKTIFIENIQHQYCIAAEFRIKTFDILAANIGNGSVTSLGTTTLDYGESKTYYFTPDANHHVKDVKVDGESIGAVGSYTFPPIDDDHDILVEFEIDSYPITITKSGSGTISPSGDVSANHGSDLTFTFTPSTGYYIKSVIADGVSVTPRSSYTFTNVTAPHTLHVEFSNVYLVHTTVVNNVGGSFTPTNPEVVYGDNVTVRISADEGYYIHKIIYEEVPLEGLRETITGKTIFIENIQHQYCIAAEFRIKTFDITASKTGSGTITSEGTTTYNYGSNKTYTFTPATGYYVSNVIVDGVSQGAISSYTFSNINADHTISVVFAINTYTITATKTGSGTMSPYSNSTVNYNGSVTYTFTPSTGYKIKNVKVDGISKGALTSYTFSNVKANHTISVEFTIKTYTIFTDSNSGGTISPSDPVVNYNSGIRIVAIPSPGYHIKKVYVDEVAVSSPTSKFIKIFDDITQNHSMSVEFEHDPVTITASQSGSGTISPSGTTTIAYGSSKTYTFSPASGYYIKNVKVNGVSKGAINTFTFSNVASNQTIWVEFAQSPYINTNVSGLGFIQTGGTKTFTISSNVSWSISSNVSWVSISPVSGSNNAIISVSCSSLHPRITKRSGALTITGGGVTKVVYVSQWQDGVMLD